MASGAHRPFSLAIGLFALSGCGGAVSLGTPPGDQRAPARSLNPTRSWISAERLKRAPALLYVAQSWPSNSVTIYDQAGSNQQPIGVINGFNQPVGLAVDRQGNLYVANALSADVLVFKRGQVTPFRTLTDPTGKQPYSVTVTHNGTVYVTNAPDYSNPVADIVIYNPGSNSPSATLRDPNIGATSLAVDAFGNILLYGHNAYGGGEVDELPAGSKTWLITGIPCCFGPNFQAELKIDAKGNIAFLNGDCTCVATYQLGSWTPIKSFPVESGFFDIALTASGRKAWISRPYNQSQGMVLEYKYRSGALLDTISSGLKTNGPVGIAAAPALIP
jgi:DNA-binding beta-propeller fold protein YncE